MKGLGNGIAVLVLCIAGIGLAHTQDLQPAPWNPGPDIPAARERPVVNIPDADREPNYAGGSCVHASMIMLMRWCGEYAEAAYHRATYQGGETLSRLCSRFDGDNVHYMTCSGGDMKFLEWCIRTRRGAGIVWMGGKHVLNLVDLTETEAAILDNNKIHKITWIPRGRFESEWKSSGGWAVALSYSPAAPMVPTWN